MKKSSLIWLIAAVCLVLIGGAVFCLTMAANRWDFSLLGNEKMETNTVSINELFQDISIRSDTEDIAFCLSEDGNCKVVYYEREKEKHTVSVRNGTLWIERKDSRNWFDRISFFSFGTPPITVYLPQTEYDSLSIEEDTGNITLPKDFTFGSMDLSLSTGHVDCLSSSSGLIRIETDTGDIRLQDLSAGELDLTVSTGHVDVRSVACEGNVGVRVSTGNAKLTDISCESINSDGSTGDITLKNVIAEDLIFIERSTGDVRFEQCDAGELEINTDTGKVTSSLLSAKVFIARSDTGDIDVPETTSGGKCRIITDTGDIKVTIANE